MDGFIIYCDDCFQSALFTNGLVEYYLTTCGKMFCQNCIQTRINCRECGENCSKKLISNNMDYEFKMFLIDVEKLEQRLQLVHAFQMKRHQTLIQHLLQQTIRKEKIVEEVTNRKEVVEDEIKQLDEEIKRLSLIASRNRSKSLNREACHTGEIPFMSKMLKAVENEAENQNENSEDHFTFMSDDLGEPSLMFKLNKNNLNLNNSIGSVLSNISQLSYHNRSGRGSIIGKAYPMRQKSMQPERNNLINFHASTSNQTSAQQQQPQQQFGEASLFLHADARFNFQN